MIRRQRKCLSGEFFFIVGVALLLLVPTARAQDQRLTLEGWGEVIDPDGDCEIGQTDGLLTISVPSTLHDLNRRNGPLNAPRVLQPVEGDFRVQVTVSGKFMPGNDSTAPKSPPFSSGGILIWHDDKSYIRLERNSFPDGNGSFSCFPPLFELRNAGRYLGANPRVTSDSFFKGESTSLRIERRENEFTAFIRHDGEDGEWTRVKSRTVDLPKQLKVGVSAINTSSNPLTVTFKDFQVTRLSKDGAAAPES